MAWWKGPARPRVVAFDIVGTVFPLEPLRPAIQALGLPPSGLEHWFAAGLRDAFALSASGDFKPFASVLGAALDQVLAEQRLPPAPAARDALIGRMKRLPPRADAVAAFETVRAAGMRIVALSNGAGAATSALLEQAGLDRLVAHVVSVEEVKRFKPHPEVYERALRVARVKARRMALVAMHPWDINGAAAAGLTTAYVAGGVPYPSSMRPPDLQADGLLEVARRIATL